MESPAQGNPAVSTSNSTSAIVRHQKTPRSLWILTAYGISGLALFGVLAYYFASYLAR
ncbi:MAG: hypothetical protein JO266_05305 [Acidobacteria bacterium]|nr:hypothetical protein [Acidobacteriota bacterium]MBV9482647.1 hypothetical protein [Acidobacteriota bacterium]